MLYADRVPSLVCGDGPCTGRRCSLQDDRRVCARKAPWTSHPGGLSFCADTTELPSFVVSLTVQVADCDQHRCKDDFHRWPPVGTATGV